MRDFETIDPPLLATACGGSSGGVLTWVRDRFCDIMGVASYAGPSGASDAAGVIEHAKDLLLIKPQAEARNDLIKTLSQANPNSRKIDKAFEKYEKGPQRKLLDYVGK